MARTCTVCTHAEREAIDRALVADGSALRDIAGQHGLSKSAVERHKAEHIPEQLVAAQRAEDAEAADDLLAQVRELQGHARTILSTSMGSGDFRMALAAIREVRGGIELFAKVREAEQLEGRIATLERQMAAPTTAANGRI